MKQQADTVETEKEETMALVEEAEVVEVAVVEEALAKEATVTRTMEEDVVAALMQAEEATQGTMDTTTTSNRGINNTHSHISNNKCLQQSLSIIPFPVMDHSSITTAWTASKPIRWVEASTVANEATKGNNGRDRPNLVQSSPSWWMPVRWTI